MKKTICITLLLVSSTIINAQYEKAKTVLDSTIAIMKVNSVNSKEIDWSKITSEAFKLAESAKTPEDLGSSIRFLMQSLDDFHGRFGYKDSIFNWQKDKIILTDEYNEAFQQKGNKFFTQQLGEIGYLRIPMTPQEITQERGQALQDSLCKLLSVNPKGLIFDLRLNYGGTMWPMILGVSNVLEKGIVGSFSYSDGRISNWVIDKENIYEDENKICSISSKCNPNLEIPIVVITGPWTASAAEDLIVALKTRPNTTFIGEPTTGAVSVVNGFKIDDDSWLNLSIAHLMDKNKTLYKTKIQPDILVVDGDDFSNLENDSKVKRAIEYIMKNR